MANVPPRPVVELGLALRGLLLRAADGLLPAWAVAWERSMGVYSTVVMGTMAELGVPDALDGGPATAQELAPRVGADADHLHRLLRTAAVHGLVRVDRRGRFRLTRTGRVLCSDAEATLRPWARYLMLDSTRDAVYGLPGGVRSGRPPFSAARGQTVWDWFADHPEEEQLFAAAMRSLTEFDVPTLIGSDLWPDEGTVCDVAGGAGTLLAGLLGDRPALRGVLVEAPGVLAEAQENLRSQGVADRVELVEGDLFGEFDATAEVYALKNILHDWDDATGARILANVARRMAPGSRLVLIEQDQPQDRPHPFASLTDLHMLTQCEGGRERSPQELQRMLSGAGLTPARVHRTGSSALVEGVAPGRQ